MNLFSQTILSGMMTGSVYALMGIGLVLVYRTSKVLNLAHGESFAAAGVATSMAVAFGVPLWLSILLGLIAGIAISLAVYRLILRPRTHWPAPALVLATLGVAFVMRGAIVALVGPDPVSFPAFLLGPPLRLVGGIIPVQGAVLTVVGFASALAVALLLRHTHLGKQLLATAENAFAAQLLGVDVERTRLIAFGLSGALAALSALFLVPLIYVDFQSGLSMTLRGFIAAAIAGMSPGRVIPAGLVLGLLEAVVGGYLGALYQDPVMFGILILIALWQSRTIRFGGARRA